MRVLVIGGGVIGATTAHALARDGHQVEVVEREPELGAQCSRAPTGQVASGHCASWASPAAPKILLNSLIFRHQALQLRWSALPSVWRWGLMFLRECTEERFTANTLAKLDLCLYSARLLDDLQDSLGVGFDYTRRGILFLHRSQPALDRARRGALLYRQRGLELRDVARDEIVAMEPALARSAERYIGAIYSEGDASGDCGAFTRGLAAKLDGAVTFRRGETVRRIVTQGDRVTAVETDAGPRTADLYVVAAGWESARLCAPLGLALPIHPVRGCSVTYPVREPAGAPEIGLIDEHYLVGMARLGDRMRLAGRAIFDRPEDAARDADFESVEQVADELFGDALDRAERFRWSCLRPMTPDGAPAIGPTPFANLHLNVGHGHIGWTMACGSAALLADLIAGRSPALDARAYDGARYWRGRRAA